MAFNYDKLKGRIMRSLERSTDLQRLWDGRKEHCV